MNEAAEVLGKKKLEITLGDDTLVLKPLRVSDLIDFEDNVGPLEEHEKSLKGTLYIVYLAARRGGATISFSQFREQIEFADMSQLESIIPALFPQTKGEGGNAEVPSVPEIGRESAGE